MDPPEDESALRSALGDVARVAGQAGVEWLVGGSIASARLGRPAQPGDIDVIVRPDDAGRLLDGLAAEGFETCAPEPVWLYKAKRDGIVVDIIFQMQGLLFLDDPMMEHGRPMEVFGTEVRVIGPEDFVLSQAMSAREDTCAYWFNALVVLARPDINWDYLVERAMRSPRRTLSLLLFAQSDDLPVPDSVVRRIINDLYEEGQ